MDPFFEITIRGQPAPAGSKTSIPLYKKERDAEGRLVPVTRDDGAVIVNTTDANPHTKPWQQQVGYAARAKYHDKPFDGAIYLEVHCFEPRPKTHYRTGQFAHLLKPDAPAYPHQTRTGDSGKLRRAIEDALSGIVWTDDKRVVQGRDAKWYVERGEAAYCVIRVAAMEAQTVADLGLVDAPPAEPADEGQLALAAAAA